VIEINPATREVVWSYEETPSLALFSPIMSNAQRLWNGNTMITEGISGRLFEVTPEGEVVWEYVNPTSVGRQRGISRMPYVAPTGTLRSTSREQ